jgi:hypothetical protein
VIVVLAELSTLGKLCYCWVIASCMVIVVLTEKSYDSCVVTLFLTV